MAAGPDGTLYVSTSDGQLHAVAPDGQPGWKTGLGTRPTAPATGPDGRIYVGGDDGALRVVNPDGTVAGAFGFDVPIRVPPLAAPDGAVYVALGDGQDYLIAFGKPELKAQYNVP
jgi:outer membrane protein assembly factor BamB